MNIFITGCSGFVGSHMVDYILANTSATVYATRRWRSRDDNIRHFYGNSRVVFLETDLYDQGSLVRALEKVPSVDYVFHFAAQSYPMSSFTTPVHTLMTNVIGTVNLMEALRIAKTVSSDTRIVSVSSSEVYGMPEEHEVPIKETNPIRAANPYSVSKIGHDYMSQFYYKAYGMKIVITRMFSHEGARRGKQFALSNFAHQIVENEKLYKEGRIPSKFFMGAEERDAEGKYVIRVGNLNSVRTYAHVLDAVHAYWLAATKGKFGEVYNIGGKYTCTVGDALENLLSKSTIPREMFRIVVDPGKIRPTDITLQIPDCSKFRRDTGWEPQRSLDDITQDLLQYWRQQI